MKRLTLCILFLLMLIAPTLAQDATYESVATQEPVMTIPPESVDTPSTQVEDENSLLKIVVAGIAAFVAGVASTLAVVAGIVRMIMSNPLWMGLAEWIGGKTIPAPLGRVVHGSLETIGQFTENISDGIAEADKPKLLKITYSDGTVYDPKTGLFTHPDGRQSHDLVYRPTPATINVDVDTLQPSSTLTRPMPLSDDPSV